MVPFLFSSPFFPFRQGAGEYFFSWVVLRQASCRSGIMNVMLDWTDRTKLLSSLHTVLIRKPRWDPVAYCVDTRIGTSAPSCVQGTVQWLQKRQRCSFSSLRSEHYLNRPADSEFASGRDQQLQDAHAPEVFSAGRLTRFVLPA
jgi:hypothetical protein